MYRYISVVYGSVKIVSNTTQDNTRSHVSGSNTARFQYTSLVIQETRHESVTSPTEYTSPTKQSSSPSKAGAKVLQNMPSPPSQKQSSPHKSFDAFLKDTNDEWSDELGYDMVNKPKPISTSPTGSKAMDHHQQQQQQGEKQSQDVNDSLSTDTSNVSKPNIETLLQGMQVYKVSIDQVAHLG